MEEMVTLVGNFGFPIVLVFYFLLRFEQKIDLLSQSLHQLSEQIKYNLNPSK